MQISLILHYIFQTANLYSCCFVVYGRETVGRSLPTSLRLAAGQRQELTDRFIFGCYPLSDAKRKRQIIVPCEASVGKPVLAAATEHAV